MHIRLSTPGAAKVTVTGIIDFDPWLFHDDNIHLRPALVGTIGVDRTVTWAKHRTFCLLARNTWNRLVQFSDGTVAVGHSDWSLALGDVLVVKP